MSMVTLFLNINAVKIFLHFQFISYEKKYLNHLPRSDFFQNMFYETNGPFLIKNLCLWAVNNARPEAVVGDSEASESESESESEDELVHYDEATSDALKKRKVYNNDVDYLILCVSSNQIYYPTEDTFECFVSTVIPANTRSKIEVTIDAEGSDYIFSMPWWNIRNIGIHRKSFKFPSDSSVRTSSNRKPKAIKPRKHRSLVHIDLIERGTFRSKARKKSNKDISGGKLTATTTLFFEMANSDVEDFVERVKFHTSLRGLDLLSDSAEPKFQLDLPAYQERMNNRNKQMIHSLFEISSNYGQKWRKFHPPFRAKNS